MCDSNCAKFLSISRSHFRQSSPSPIDAALYESGAVLADVFARYESLPGFENVFDLVLPLVCHVSLRLDCHKIVAKTLRRLC